VLSLIYSGDFIVKHANVSDVCKVKEQTQSSLIYDYSRTK